MVSSVQTDRLPVYVNSIADRQHVPRTMIDTSQDYRPSVVRTGPVLMHITGQLPENLWKPHLGLTEHQHTSSPSPHRPLSGYQYHHHHNHRHRYHHYNQAYHHRRLLHAKRSGKSLQSKDVTFRLPINSLPDSPDSSSTNCRLQPYQRSSHPKALPSFKSSKSVSSLTSTSSGELNKSPSMTNEKFAQMLPYELKPSDSANHSLECQCLLEPHSNKSSPRSANAANSSLNTSTIQRCRRRRRPHHRKMLHCGSAHSGETGHRIERAEQRRERSRLAAQIRRNRESQNLMLLQNALPISTEVLGLHGIVTEAGGLLNLFTKEEDPALVEDLFSLLNPSDPEFESNSPVSNRHSNGLTTSGSALTSKSTSAINLEKADIIRITGHTLFLLNHMYRYLGTTATPTLSLHSQSLYGLLIDPTDMRIVYATPALAERIGWTWINLIGNSLNNVIHPNWNRFSSSVSPCPPGNSSSSRRKACNPCLSDPQLEYDSVSSSGSTSGIGTTTGSSLTTSPSCSPQPLEKSMTSSPTTALQSTKHFWFSEFFEIYRPTPIDPASCRTLLAGLLDRIDSVGRTKTRCRKKRSTRYNTSAAALSPQMVTSTVGTGETNPVSRRHDCSKFPQVFHCWYSTTLRFPPEPHSSSDGCHFAETSELISTKSDTDNRNVKIGAIDDTDESGCSSDTEAAQQTDDAHASLSLGGVRQQQQQQRSQPTLSELQLCLLQPIPQHCRPYLRSLPTEARVGPPTISQADHLQESRGSRRRRSRRRRSVGRAKQSPGSAVFLKNSNSGTENIADDSYDGLDPNACDLIAQLSQFDLSSITAVNDESPPCPCASCTMNPGVRHDIPFRMQLDLTGKILSVEGSLDHPRDLPSGSSLCGRPFLALVHLDDLERVLQSMQNVLRYRSMGWTAIYRISVQWPDSIPCSTRRTYRWVRTLFEPISDNNAALHCWHQSIGLSPESVHWSDMPSKPYSEPLFLYEEGNWHTKRTAESIGPLLSDKTAATPTLPSCVDSEIDPISLQSDRKTVVFPSNPQTVTTANPSPTPFPLPPGVRALRIIQMPEQKRWTVEIPSTAMSNRSYPVLLSPKSHSVGSCPKPDRNRNSSGTGMRRNRKAVQASRVAPYAQTSRGVGHHLPANLPRPNQLSWFDTTLPPVVSIYSTARKNKRKVSILMRKHAQLSPTAYKPRHSGLVSLPKEGYVLSLSSSSFTGTPQSDVSHGSCPSVYPSPLGGVGYTPWLPSDPGSISTPFLSPSVEELAHVSLGSPLEQLDQTVLMDMMDDQAVLDCPADDQPLFVATAEAFLA